MQPRYLLEIEGCDSSDRVTAELLDRESSHIVMLAPDPRPLHEVLDSFHYVAMFLPPDERKDQPFSGRFPGREENGERGVHISTLSCTEINSNSHSQGPEVPQCPHLT